MALKAAGPKLEEVISDVLQRLSLVERPSCAAMLQAASENIADGRACFSRVPRSDLPLGGQLARSCDQCEPVQHAANLCAGISGSIVRDEPSHSPIQFGANPRTSHFNEASDKRRRSSPVVIVRKFGDHLCELTGVWRGMNTIECSELSINRDCRDPDFLTCVRALFRRQDVTDEVELAIAQKN